MKHRITPNRAVAWAVLIFIYVMLSVAILFNQVPQMLRAADTLTNYLAVIVIFIWIVVTGYIGWHVLAKPKPSRNRRK